MKKNKSKKYFKQAKKVIPGGVNSPVRAFKAVGSSPLFIEKAKGPYIWDVDGNKYIDYCLSWGPMILGHADQRVLGAVRKVLSQGTSFGAPTKREVELANLVTKIYPSIEKLRLTSSGTEAAMSAIRLARGYTGRDKIIKFEGCYHGHCDSLLVKAGSGAATFGVPTSKGVTKATAGDTITLPFNNIGKVESAIAGLKGKVACVIIEPIPANMGVILPKPGFLKKIREITANNNIILIFDEVITGFRASLAGAQGIFKIKPDLTILGKIIGGGFPMAGFGGKGEIMDCLSPDGGVYQAGTLSGNPIAVEAGITALNILMQDKGIYKELEEKASVLETGLVKVTRNTPCKINRFGSLFTIFFTDKKEILDYNSVSSCNFKMFTHFFNKMLARGIYLSCSQFEANFVSTKHKYSDIEKTIKSAEYALKN